MSMKIFAVSNQKGGVGKTTTTLNLASALQALGLRVLVLDNDPQGNLTSSLLPEPADRKQSMSELIHYTVAGMTFAPETFICHAAGGLDVVVSSKLLAAANSLLGTVSDSYAVMRRAIAILTHDGADYDVVLIDCAPALDLLVNNALSASDGIIIPTEPADYSIDGIVGVYETVSRIQSTNNPQLTVAQIIINKFDTRKKTHHAAVATIMEAFDGLVYPSPIPLIKEVEISAVDYTAMRRSKHSKAWPIYVGIAEVISHGW